MPESSELLRPFLYLFMKWMKKTDAPHWQQLLTEYNSWMWMIISSTLWFKKNLVLIVQVGLNRMTTWLIIVGIRFAKIFTIVHNFLNESDDPLPYYLVNACLRCSCYYFFEIFCHLHGESCFQMQCLLGMFNRYLKML